MLSGLFFLTAAGAIVVVVLWSIQNDRVGPFEKTKGLLAMDDGYESGEVSPKKPKRREGRSRSRRRMYQ